MEHATHKCVAWRFALVPYTSAVLLTESHVQGSRMRNTKTEYVSCPSCGRTLFDLQEVTEQIRQRTGHLPGVSIAVMGCIVNGPGEMADADFGCTPAVPGTGQAPVLSAQACWAWAVTATMSRFIMARLPEALEGGTLTLQLWLHCCEMRQAASPLGNGCM